MHELGIVFEVVKVVEQVAVEQNLPAVDTIVLQVGELCGVIPVYLDECWPAAIDKKPYFKNTKLKLDIVPGMANVAIAAKSSTSSHMKDIAPNATLSTRICCLAESL